MNNNNNGNIIPIITYTNLGSNKYILYQENKNKSGIYRWNNLITGLSYIGSAVNLNKRLTNYFSRGLKKKEVIRNNSIISNSLLKHDYINFSLDILEYCEYHNLIIREQYYLDLLKPEYNILPIAGSRLGAKYSPETLLKFKTRKLSPEALANLKLAKAGWRPVFTPLRKINQLLATGHITTVINRKDGSTKVYDSIRSAAKDLGTNHVTLLNYMNSDKLLKGIYSITRKFK